MRALDASGRLNSAGFGVCAAVAGCEHSGEAAPLIYPSLLGQRRRFGVVGVVVRGGVVVAMQSRSAGAWGWLLARERALYPVRLRKEAATGGIVTVAATRGKVVFHDPRRDLLDQRSDCLHQTQRSRASAVTNQHHRSICSRPTMALSQPGASHAAATGDTAPLRCIGATGTLGRRSGARLFNNAGLTRSLSAPLN